MAIFVISFLLWSRGWILLLFFMSVVRFDWLGICSQTQNRKLYLSITERQFMPHVNSKHIMNDGTKGEDQRQPPPPLHYISDQNASLRETSRAFESAPHPPSPTPQITYPKGRIRHWSCISNLIYTVPCPQRRSTIQERGARRGKLFTLISQPAYQ